LNIWRIIRAQIHSVEQICLLLFYKNIVSDHRGENSLHTLSPMENSHIATMLSPSHREAQGRLLQVAGEEGGCGSYQLWSDPTPYQGFVEMTVLADLISL
jgi:hypothetical protein